MNEPSKTASLPSMADMIVRYDLDEMTQEVKVDFTGEAGSRRLLDQSDISKRFQRKPKRKTQPSPGQT